MGRRRPGHPRGRDWSGRLLATHGRVRSDRRVPAGEPDRLAGERFVRRRRPFQYALLFAGLGDQDRTIEQLQQMAGVGAVRMGFTLNSPEFAVLNGDAPVKALRHQVGLPE